MVSQSVQMELGVGHICGLHVETWSKLWETWGSELKGDTHEGFVGSTTIKVWTWRSSLETMQRGTLRMNSLNGKAAGKCSQGATRGLPGWHCGHQGATARPPSPQSAAPAVRGPLAPVFRADCWPQPWLGEPTVPEGKGSPRSTMSMLPCRREEGKGL